MVSGVWTFLQSPSISVLTGYLKFPFEDFVLQFNQDWCLDDFEYCLR